MPTQEEVLIVLKAKDEVSKTVENIRKNIENLGRAFNNSMPDPSKFTQPLNDGVGGLGSAIEQTSYRMSGFGKLTSDVGSQANINFSQMAERMDKFHVGLNRVTNAMTGLFGTMGLWGMAHESWMFATQRQTNQIYLGMRRGTDEAKNMYNEIQNIVMELPGDDTFLTTILTQASGRDMTMSIENVKTLGDAIADYYVGATAKGQLSYETQRELTSYILTGETRMFTNSILADEIDLLKNKNTVTERATALQEALNRTGFEGMAHYESATNAMEEFKGHFQKAFADLGSMALPFMQGILGIYNAFDSLVGNGGISAGIIVLATSIAGLTTALGTIGFVTPMVNEGVRSLVLFGQGIRNIREGIANGGVFKFLTDHIHNLVLETRGLITPLEEVQAITSAKQIGLGFNFDTMTSAPLYEMENGVMLTNTELKLQNLMATTRLSEQELALAITLEGKTYEQYLNNVGLEANTMAKLQNVAQSMEMSEAELLNLAVTSDMTTAEFLETLEINLNSIATDNATLSTIMNTEAELENETVVNAGILSRLRGTATKIWDAVCNTTVAIGMYILGDAETREQIINESGTLSRLRSIATKVWETAQNFWEAFSLYTVVDGEVVLNTEKTIGIITRVQEIVTIISNAIALNIEGASAVGEAGAEAIGTGERLISIATRIWHTLVIGGETVAMYGLIGAGALLDIVLSPIVVTILAIIGVALLLIQAIEWVGEAFGWWSDFGSMFDAISSGLQRIWDAFVNSEPVQQIITTFQNLWYTIESLFNFLGSIGGGLWELIFGVGDGEESGTFDIVGLLLEIGGAIGNFLYWLSPLEEILAIFDAIGSAIAWVLDTWNEFIDSAEMQGLIQGFQEVREAFGEVWDEFSTVIGEISSLFGEIWSSIFGGGETEEATGGTNVLLELLKAVAWVLNNTLVPVLKAFAFVLHIVITPLHWLADALRWVLGGFQDTNDTVEQTTNQTNLLGGVFGSIVESLQNLWNAIQPIIEIVSMVMSWLITEIIDDIRVAIEKLIGTVRFFISVGQFVVGVFQDIWNAIGGLDGIVGGVAWAFNSLMQFLQPVGDIIGFIVDKIQWLADTFGWASDELANFLGQDGNLNATANVNYGEQSSMGLLDSFGISPDQLNATANIVNNELNKNNQAYLNRDIKNMNNTDPISKYLTDGHIDAEAYGYLTQPVDYSKTPQMTEPYKTVNSQNQQIVQNIFNEGSVQADARNMSAKDVQSLFTGAFGYNKSRGTQGILK